MRISLALLMMVGLTSTAGCATAVPPPIPENLERITFEPRTPPFCGDCRSTTVTVVADGRIWVETGHWAGHYRDWRTRRSVVIASPQIYSQFKAALEPFRPMFERVPLWNEDYCAGRFTFDSAEAVVTWSDDRGSVRRVFSEGCAADQAMNRSVWSARDALPVRD